MVAEVRDYQVRLIDKTVHLFNHGFKSVLLNSPTGSGKSYMGLDIVKRLQEQHNVGAAWVAMRRNLLKQITAENEKLGVGAQIVPFSMFNRNPPTHDQFGRPIRIIVLDESQHDPAGSMTNIYNVVRPKWILGMTATPFRTDRMRLSFDKIIRDIGIHQLIQLGYLSPYHQYTIPKWDVDEVVSCYLREPERWGKSAIYFRTRDESEACCNQLVASGIRAATVFGNQPASEREEKLAQFESGELQVLVNMVLLTEGWDSPSLKTVFVRNSQRGPTIQMAGRVFRKFGGIQFKQIVQSKLTHWPIQRTAAPAHASVWLPEENEWRSYAQSEAIEKVSMRVCITLAHTKTEMPAGLVKRMAKGRRRRSQRDDNGRVDRTTESGLPRRDDSGLDNPPHGWVGNFGGGAIIH
ncbi:MAG: DEAD/DEAH box helicase family protein [Candidatus Paceibacterota bacterium]|jgi:superfamily II DNA or RNA helicase